MFTDISPFRVNQPLGYQTLNRIRDDVFTLAAARFQHFLGGSRAASMPRAILSDAVDYIDIELDSTQLIGLSCQLRVELRTSTNPGTVTPILRNITDGIDVAVGSPAQGTAVDYTGTGQIQTIPVQLSPGLKKYRLRTQQSASSFDAWCIGYLELFYASNVVSIGSANFSYASGLVAPPLNAEIRFDAGHPYTDVTKIFVSSTSVPGADVHAQLMVILPGSICYIEDIDNHLQWVRYETLVSPIDHGTYVEIPVKWSANGQAFAPANEVRFYAPSAGGQALPHHRTHETGGTDAITNLDAAVIQTGTLLDGRMSPNVAMTTRMNHFTGGWQYLDGQSLVFRDVSAAVGSKDFRAHYASGFLDFESMNEVTGNPVGSPNLRVQYGAGGAVFVQRLQSAGDIVTTGAGVLRVISNNASLYLLDTSVAANTGQFRIMSQFSGGAQKLIFYKQDDAESGFFNLMNIDRTGNVFVTGQLSAASLVSGAAALGATTMQGTLVVQGTIQSGGYIFPGRNDAPGLSQGSFFLASHFSYGLFSNTGLYLQSANLTVAAGSASVAGSVTAGGNIIASGLLQGIQQPRIAAYGTAQGFTIDMNLYDMATVDAANGSLSIGPPANPRDGLGLIIRVRDQGGAIPIYWDGHFMAGGGVPLPNATVAPAKTMWFAFRYNAVYDRWFMLALSVEP